MLYIRVCCALILITCPAFGLPQRTAKTILGEWSFAGRLKYPDGTSVYLRITEEFRPNGTYRSAGAIEHGKHIRRISARGTYTLKRDALVMTDSEEPPPLRYRVVLHGSSLVMTGPSLPGKVVFHRVHHPRVGVVLPPKSKTS